LILFINTQDRLCTIRTCDHKDITGLSRVPSKKWPKSRGNGQYVFPCARATKRPMSGNTINAGLRRIGFTNDQMTGHGFRSMASTLLNEQGWNRNAIERQLAHAERNNIRGNCYFNDA